MWRKRNFWRRYWWFAPYPPRLYSPSIIATNGKLTSLCWKRQVWGSLQPATTSHNTNLRFSRYRLWYSYLFGISLFGLGSTGTSKMIGYPRGGSINIYLSTLCQVMYTILTGHDKELQMCAKNAIQTYQKSKGQDIVLETVTSEIRPLLQQLPETKKLSIHLIEVDCSNPLA